MSLEIATPKLWTHKEKMLPQYPWKVTGFILSKIVSVQPAAVVKVVGNGAAWGRLEPMTKIQKTKFKNFWILNFCLSFTFVPG